jgi:NADPH-dependent glutamate synthase beta subunit-like oxidoreductase
VRLEWVTGDDGRMRTQEVAGSAFELKADLVLLAMGFLGPRLAGLVEQGGVDLDSRGNVKPVSPTTGLRSPASSPAATCGGANRWWSGPSAKAANAPAPSTST